MGWRQDGYIGYYDTAVQAAVAYAKHAAGEIMVVEPAAPAPGACAEACAEACACAGADTPEVEVKEVGGYKLFLSKTSATGYMGVREQNGRFQARRKVDGKYVHIGVYDTAVEAAVAYAKHAAGEEVVRPVPAAAMEVEVKEAEGYQLFVSKTSTTGYKGVTEVANCWFIARRWVDGEQVHLGGYATAVEAAVAYARHVALRRSLLCGR